MSERISRVFLMAGGGRGNRKAQRAQAAEAFERLGCRKPRLAYIGAASDDNPEFFSWIENWFHAAGAEATVLAPLCGDSADPGEARAVLGGADAVFVSGGDVEAGMVRLSETGIAADLDALSRRGVPFIGLSAGSIMLCRKWVRWPDPSDDDAAEVFPCMGIAPILCDTHSESDGWTELRALLNLCGKGTKGYGIETGGALLVGPSGNLEALWKPLAVFGTTAGGVGPVREIPPQAAIPARNAETGT